MKFSVPQMIRRIQLIHERLQAVLNRIALSDQGVFESGVRLHHSAAIHNLSGNQAGITIGENSVILGEISAYCKGAYVHIGKESYVGPNSNIMAFAAIKIGSRVQISHNVNIYDNNSHSLSASARYEHMRTILTKGHPESLIDIEMEAIEIGDDAWIGFGSTILKGVRIGRGAIVGAGTMVTYGVPDFSIVVGNPQRVIGNSRP
jgi:maltose O-acetyltransferase